MPMVGHRTIRYCIVSHPTLYSDHCDVCTSALEEVSKETVVQMVQPTPCDCTKAVSTAVKEAAQARQSIISE